jgi:ADP-ribosyl-[dinitrogen reductase] hydrolase
MIGAIIGDIAGSTYEFIGNKDYFASLFPKGSDYTDDTILTIATAHTLLSGLEYRKAYQLFGQKYPDPMGGYGMRFAGWLEAGADAIPYDSWGNGAAMRAGPIGWAFSSLDETLAEAEKSASVSHNHPEGIKGAHATAMATWMARHGKSKTEIRQAISQQFRYDLSRSATEVRKTYSFNESCQGTVPEALIAFLDSTDFEDAIRIAISLGGDADTVGCITGGIAEAFYREIPQEMKATAERLLPQEFVQIVHQFTERYPV